MSGMRLQASENAYYYPDVMVVSDPSDDHLTIKRRPCLVVELLSPSTASTHRREKLLAYQGLDSLTAYIMVYQDEMRVARQWRDENGAWWQAEISGEGFVPIPCPEITLSLADERAADSLALAADTSPSSARFL